MITQKKNILDLKKIVKRFPGVIALDEVDFKVDQGEVHGLVGKNGAGKSTLVNILYGRIPFDYGEIYVKGKQVKNLKPELAQELGISLVPQEPQNIPNLSIAENLLISNLKTKNTNLINWREIKNKAEEVIEKLEMNIDVNIPIGELAIGQQQLLSIGKAFFIDKTDIILLDEVTTSLSKKYEEILFKLIKERKEKGTAVIVITHILKEIMYLCDRVTILRNGKNVACRNVKDLNEKDFITLIVGKETKNINDYVRRNEFNIQKKGNQEYLLSVNKLSRINEFEDVNFRIKKKEIVGIAGLRGAGKTELMKCIAGITQKDIGEIYYKGGLLNIKNPKDALKIGIAFLPEDREREGIVSQLSVKENLSLSSLDKLINFFGFIKLNKEVEKVNKIIEKLQVVLITINQEVSSLSGGNKQKVLIGKLLLKKPELYLLDEITRGIDVELKTEILKIIVTELKQESGIIITSPQIEELLMICDRILIMYEGKIVGEFTKEEFDEANIYKTMQGLKGV